MGDLTGSANAEGLATALPTQQPRESMDVLKETKECADITNTDNAAAPVVDQSPEKDNDNPSHKHIETVYENASMDKTQSSEAPLHIVPDPPQELTNMVQTTGRMNKLRDHSSNIFPVGIMGCKEDVTAGAISPRRFIDAHEASRDSIGHIENTPRKMPSAKLDSSRNILTGTGMDADERKSPQKKRDGNPVLGVGYDKAANSSSTRIPPGGFSHGLW